MMSSGKSADRSNVCPSSVSGTDYLRDPRLFKGMGFSLEERQALGIHGLLPPRMKTMDEQVDNCLRNCEFYFWWFYLDCLPRLEPIQQFWFAELDTEPN